MRVPGFQTHANSLEMTWEPHCDPRTADVPEDWGRKKESIACSSMLVTCKTCKAGFGGGV